MSTLLTFLVLSPNFSLAQQSMPIAKIDAEISRKGEIVWVDLVTKDGGASAQFFKDLLGWEFEVNGPYSLAKSGEKPVAGIIEDKELLAGEKVSHWVLSAAVTNVKATVKVVTSAGGTVLSKPAEIPGRGMVALVEDDQGAFFAIMSNKAGDPKASAPENGEWMWAELWTADPNAAIEFYKEVLGSTTRAYDGMGVKEYFILKGDTYESAGITQIPVEDEDPIWIPVMRVANADEMANKAKKLGGSIMMNPRGGEGTRVALIATPTGAPFLIQEWSK